MGEKLGLLC